ncbi:succinate semialdehyde dehydrogenase [Ephemerocybe angulata]|uniref:Succinate semialdehyde dehydrogenase n=1 Tax=Ephemerocybe angulata TaxID=980116 RepID=A0A8H6I309_9AGAR|nr:succinate semialdehyde dehydrogenase [Tulosesus angulatus]
MSLQTTITPHSQAPYVERTYPTPAELDAAIAAAAAAQPFWAATPLAQRIAIGRAFIKEFEALKEEIPLELTLQMGRPVQQGPGEVRGLVERSNYMLDIAPTALADVSLADTDKPGFKRYIKRVPIGVVFVIAPWNFPYLTTINSLLPALLAGNTVLLKPSPQTPLTAERIAAAFARAGLPPNVLTVLHLGPEGVAQTINAKQVGFVSFTGSVPVGRTIAETAAKAPGFTGTGLELGGKDPAYVAPDADLDFTVAELVDGAFFNSGQSCCSIERIYVHAAVYEPFVAKFVALTKEYKLGDPTTGHTNLGPVVSLASAERIRKQVADAVAQGARSLVPENLFPAAKPGTTYVGPQVLVNVNHTMDVMTEETFGPVVGIQRVSSAAEALELMNDSRYGLTASVWTDVECQPRADESEYITPAELVEYTAKGEVGEGLFDRMVEGLETGTVFLNRCDYLDPALAWSGVKDSGRGVSLSKFGYDQLTRPKSVHMKISLKTSV